MHSPSQHHISPALPAGYPPAGPAGQLAVAPDPAPQVVKVRWVRVLAALALIGAGAFLLTTQLTGSPAPTKSANNAIDSVNSPAAKSVTPPAPKPKVTPRVAAQPKTPPPARARTTDASPAVVSGGGVNAATAVSQQRTSAGEPLPFTGMPVWSAALLGFALLAGGIWLQRNALQVGTAATGYRRGPALRPIQTVRALMGS